MTLPPWVNLLLLFAITLGVIATCVAVWGLLGSSDPGMHTVGLGFGPWILALAVLLACVIAAMLGGGWAPRGPRDDFF
jgi:hypothetical protein